MTSTKDISNLYVGSSAASALFVGTTKVWPPNALPPVASGLSRQFVAADLFAGTSGGWQDRVTGQMATGVGSLQYIARSGVKSAPAAYFDGSTALGTISTDFGPDYTACVAFVVYSANSTVPSTQYMLGAYGPTNGNNGFLLALATTGAAQNVSYDNAGSAVSSNVSSVSVMSNHIWSASRSGLNVSSQVDATVGSSATNTPTYGIVTSNHNFSIGGYVNGAPSFNGWIYEILLYNRALSAAELSSVNAYLKNLYGP